MDRLMLKQRAKEQINGNIGVLFLIYFIVSVIGMLLALIPQVGTVLSFVASTIFEIQIIVIFLALANGVTPEIPRLFDIFKNSRLCGNSILLHILTMVYTFVWSLLFLVPGIIKALSYAMSPYILAENDYYMTPQDAIKESIRIMNGHKTDLFVLYLSFIGWYILTLLTCGIVGIYFFPYYRATMTNFYNEIKDKPMETPVVE